MSFNSKVIKFRLNLDRMNAMAAVPKQRIYSNPIYIVTYCPYVMSNQKIGLFRKEIMPLFQYTHVLFVL